MAKSLTTLWMAETLNENKSGTRRSLLTKVLGATSISIVSNSPFSIPANAEDDILTPVYFGTGCFWHIQREFVEAERRILGRSDKEITSRTGYAGGTKTDGKGRVCYHNLAGAGDYGKMGHGEVVGMTIPDSRISDFAKVYFSLFDPRTGDRVDPGDKGGEYRYLLGLPGGEKHPRFGEVEAAATAAGKRLVAGRGGDPDTYRQGIVYYYNTEKFPFYQAEIYHQFHNDFQSPPYGKKYNDLADLEFTNGGFIRETGCPEGYY